MSGSDDTNHQLQPHLSGADGAGVDNPGLAADAADVKVKLDTHPTWEKFDDDDGSRDSKSQRKQNDADSSSGQGQNKQTLAHPPSNAAAGTTQHSAANDGQTTHSNGTSRSQGDPSSPGADKTPTQQTKVVSPHPVIYNTRSGEAVVVTTGVMVTSADVDRSGEVIGTRQIPERWRDLENRPLKARRMKILKILSIIAAIVFFPTGLPALYFAHRMQKEFNEGIIQGNIDRALKFARRTEHLLILTVVAAILVVVLIFALVERASMGYTVDNSYIGHSGRPT